MQGLLRAVCVWGLCIQVSWELFCMQRRELYTMYNMCTVPCILYSIHRLLRIETCNVHIISWEPSCMQRAVWLSMLVLKQGWELYCRRTWPTMSSLDLSSVAPQTVLSKTWYWTGLDFGQLYALSRPEKMLGKVRAQTIGTVEAAWEQGCMSADGHEPLFSVALQTARFWRWTSLDVGPHYAFSRKF